MRVEFVFIGILFFWWIFIGEFGIVGRFFFGGSFEVINNISSFFNFEIGIRSMIRLYNEVS